MNSFIRIRATFAITLFCLIAFAVSGVVNAATIQILEGTPVKLKFKKDLKITSGAFKKNDIIPVTLDQPIDMNGIILVGAGAEGQARVVEVEKAKRGGKPGSIKIEFVEIKPNGKFNLSEGDAINLKGGQIEATGKKKGFWPYCFFKFILKGGEAEIETDKVYEVEVAETVLMQSNE